MIPPAPPGQQSGENMVRWVNTHDMRQTTLASLAASNLTFRTKGFFSKMRNGCESSATKSLDILRRNLQSAITKEIDAVIKKYMDKFFQPALENIRNNLGKDSVNEDHLKEVCGHILDDVKLLYQFTPQSRDSSPYECSDSDTSNMGLQRNIESRKRKESDTDSENSQSAVQKRRLKSQNFTFDGPKWNPDRVTPQTLFIMGARANKALGYGQTRGRLYVRHPDIMRYAGDPEDKDWLSRHSLLPANGGKAYLMILEDIKELAETEEYRQNPCVLLHEMLGFEIPAFMTVKIKKFMEQVRERQDVYEFRQNSPDVSLSSLMDGSLRDDLGLYVAQGAESTSTESSFLSSNQMGINQLFNSGPPTLSYMPKRIKKMEQTGFNLEGSQDTN